MLLLELEYEKGECIYLWGVWNILFSPKVENKKVDRATTKAKQCCPIEMRGHEQHSIYFLLELHVLSISLSTWSILQIFYGMSKDTIM